MSQPDLFNEQSFAEGVNVNPQPIELYGSKTSRYYPNLLAPSQAQALYDALLKELDWEQPSIVIAGREIAIPRLQVWFGDNSLEYTYSNMTFKAVPWHPKVLELKQVIEAVSDRTFNSALCNLYRHGGDSVAWHADDEIELGKEAVIASFSLGETRSFQLRRKDDHHKKYKLDLCHNDLLVMGAGVQNHWEHQIPKTKKNLGPRINLTFRTIV